jgi:uncharacterized membrane protein YebE (DUF533 family)
MSSTAYDRYLQQSRSLASSIGQQEGNLHTDWRDKYEAEADRQLTTKTLDVGKAAFDVAQGESIMNMAILGGTTGLAAIQGSKKIYGAVKNAYSKHYEDKDEDADEGDADEAVDAPQGEGVQEEAQVHPQAEQQPHPEVEEDHGAGVEEAQAPEAPELRGGEIEMPERPEAELGGDEEPLLRRSGGDEEMRDMGEVEPRENVPLQDVGDRPYGGMYDREEPEAGEAVEGAEGGEAGAGVAEEVGGEAVERGVGGMVADAVAGVAERSMVADLALQSLPFIGEAVDVGLLAYGVYEGYEQYKKGQAEQSAASGDPTNPPESYGLTAPSLNNALAIPIFDSSRGHDSGHVTAF